MCVCVLYKQPGVKGGDRRFRGGRDLGTLEKTIWDLGKTWKMDHQNTLKRKRKGEGGCGSVVCIGLKCMCD